MVPLPAGIGPHEDHELELLLAGTKPLAMLISEPAMNFMQDLTAFEPHVISGRLIRVDTPSPDGLFLHHYFCLPTEEWRIKLLEAMHTIWQQPGHGGFTCDDYARLEGHLLGYTKADIETFITHSNHKNPQT